MYKWCLTISTQNNVCSQHQSEKSEKRKPDSDVVGGGTVELVRRVRCQKTREKCLYTACKHEEHSTMARQPKEEEEEEEKETPTSKHFLQSLTYLSLMDMSNKG